MKGISVLPGSRLRRPSALMLTALLAMTGSARANTSHWDAASGTLPEQMTCPWTKVNNTPNQPAISGGKLTISTNTTGGNNTYYSQGLPSGGGITMPPDSLVVEFNVRYVSGATGN